MGIFLNYTEQSKGGLSVAGRKESLSDFEQEVYQNQSFAATVIGNTLSNIDSQEIKHRQFELNFRESLRPNLSESEVVDCFVNHALKTEFGSSFVANTGFPRLKRIVSQAVLNAAEVKREILNYTSKLLSDRLGLTGKIPQ